MTAEHLVGLTDEALCFRDAGPQGCLTRLNLPSLLLASLGALRSVRH
jgi:hypothetical protein